VVLRLDHVVYAVRDLDVAAARMRADHGLDSVAGGRHPGWGTVNRIVPLGQDYVELIAIEDDAAAARSAFGRSLRSSLDAGEGWFTICAASDDLDAVAARLGAEIEPGERVRPDGGVVRWRRVDPSGRESWLPFFIAWDVAPALHPGRARAGHGVRAEGLAWVEVGGDAERLRAWLGGEDVPIRVVEGRPGVRRVAIATAGGELVI
jgi:hypothetical protein